MAEKLFIYGFPGPIGGADTKLDHTLPLFTELGFEEIMCVANQPGQLKGDSAKKWLTYLDSLGIKYGLKEDMKGYKEGDIALSLCNDYFFEEGFCTDAKSKGLKVIWSSEMMWHHREELDYVNKGMVDKVLYTSVVQKSKLTYPENMPYTITGNYVDPDRFPFNRKSMKGLSIGRLSRADPFKYTENFPNFYQEMVEGLPPRDILFRIMAWDKPLADKYSWFKFNDKHRWILHAPMQIDTLKFLSYLNIFAYPLGHNFIESWGRSTVEAMLTGCIPVSYSGHHIDNLIINGETGYIADDIYEWKSIMKNLFHDIRLRHKMSERCAEHAREKICNKQQHINLWKTALDV